MYIGIFVIGMLGNIVENKGAKKAMGSQIYIKNCKVNRTCHAA